MNTHDATIIGSGIAGLSCAIALAERGHRVEVVSRAIHHTVSEVAASIWALPFVERTDRVHRWALETRSRLLAEASESQSVRVIGLKTIALEDFAADPWMSGILPRTGTLAGTELPEPYGFGAAAETLLIDSSRYLPWLRDRLRQLGGTLTERTVTSLDELGGGAPVVVAAGCGSAALLGDDTVSGLEASVIRVANPGIADATIVRDGPLAPLFIVPRFDDVVIGGGGTSETPERIVARAARIEPKLEGAPILSAALGSRPVREAIRVEIERAHSGRRPVISCYGHGGAGFSTCWGTARAVLDLLEAA